MARHNHTGSIGENLAITYFINKGHEILHTNWRHKNWEVDIISSQNGILHFIEVKTRTSLKFGYPEENVDTKKIKYLINAAEEFLIIYPHWQRIQFDVLSINMKEDNSVDYFLIDDVYL
ncbi:MAG: YraN family protein [Ferruginibacter sp.]